MARPAKRRSAIIDFAIFSRGFRRAVLIGLGVIVVGVALLFYDSSTADYRKCVALMWDRKHPAEVKRLHLEEATRKCEKDRLSGVDSNSTCDPNTVVGECERLARELWTECIKNGYRYTVMSDAKPPENPCLHLSLEELRRADAEASRDKPPR